MYLSMDVCMYLGSADPLNEASAIECTPNHRPVACLSIDRTRLSSPTKRGPHRSRYRITASPWRL